MSDQELLYEVKDQVAWITLNREARRNALSLDMIDIFFEYLDRAESAEEVRVICLTGAGEKAFCTGADLSSTFQADDFGDGAKKYAALLKRMSEFSKPIVARINGHCLAGGMGFMLSCDIAYAQEGAKFGTPEVNVGLFPMMIGALIFRNTTRKKALEMIYTAEMLTAKQAEEMGLITRAVPPEELDNIVNKALESIAAKAPLAVEMGRKALAAAEDMSLPDALDYLSQQLCAVVATDDAKEGLMAFMQKRQPEWKRK